MLGLVPGIHEFPVKVQSVDGRNKPGHDEDGYAAGNSR
jgi:hypothetical protein